MSSYFDLNLPDYEKLVSCPYNQAHQVVQHRMPKHLIKCRRSHSSAGTKECRFNCTHVHPIEEIAYHEALCSDRLTVELDMTKKPELNPKAPQDSGFIQGPQHSARDADWDNLEPVPTYNAKKFCRDNDVMLHVQHGTPSTRKTQRDQEHQRLTMIRNNKIPGTSSAQSDFNNNNCK